MYKAKSRSSNQRTAVKQAEKELRVAAKILRWEIGDSWDMSAFACPMTAVSRCKCFVAPRES
jgi:hypothetical protein